MWEKETTDPFRNDVYSDFEPKKQDYQAWRANPEKYKGFWDKYYGRPRPFEVPDYRIYNSIKGIWQLEYVESFLATKGLKDPWMRNEIWKYPPDNKLAGPKYLWNLVAGPKSISLKLGLAAAVFMISFDHVRWYFQYGGSPPWKYNFVDWIKEFADRTSNL